MKEKLEKIGVFDPMLWVEDGRWVQSPFGWMFFMHWHHTNVVKRIISNRPLGPLFSIDGYAFHSLKARKDIYDHIKALKEKDQLKSFVEDIDKEGYAAFAKVSEKLAQPDEYFFSHMDEFISLYKELIGFWTISTFCGDQMTILAKDTQYTATEADLFAKVHPYLRDTWIEKEVHAIRNIAEKYIQKYSDNDIEKNTSSDPELQSMIQTYIHNFAGIRISKWIGEQIDAAYAYKRLGEEIDNVRKGNHIKLHKASTDDAGYDGVVALCVASAYWRAQCAEMEMKTAVRLKSLIAAVAKINAIDFKQVLLLTPGEFVTVFNDPSHIIKNKEAILKREKVYFNTVSDDGEEIIVTPHDPEYALLADLYLKKQVAAADRPEFLKGIGASKGNVRGFVRVIESSQQFDTFKEGEILVAAETSPTFVPLMRASAAILTGKGGITSHAAIVSRELGKPCIIAIKDVTRILKTGDEVEIDAGKGIVRIIK